ncbi:MAG: DUF6145 family protein [Eubacteriales bacterium]|nr:DUF6145 family protein [Eubacteriales bacterium]
MEKVLCGANATNMKYYFNEEEFGILPQAVKDELKVLLVKYTSDIGGAITLQFSDSGRLAITTYDPIDDIGAELKIKKMQQDNEEFFSQLEEFYKAFKK